MSGLYDYSCIEKKKGTPTFNGTKPKRATEEKSCLRTSEYMLCSGHLSWLKLFKTTCNCLNNKFKIKTDGFVVLNQNKLSFKFTPEGQRKPSSGVLWDYPHGEWRSMILALSTVTIELSIVLRHLMDGWGKKPLLR